MSVTPPPAPAAPDAAQLDAAQPADQGVTAPAGFEAAGVAVGLKSTGKPDVAVVVNRGPLKVAAAVFTSNRAKANPILWSQQVIADGVAEAIVLNSGGANCFTGSFGFQTTHQTAERAAELLGVGPGDILVCSTGLIGSGDETFRAKVLDGTAQAIAALSPDSGPDAAHAIMTTDTVAKTVTIHGDGWTIGAMAKGAGMLAPGLATMLVVITTDAVLTAAQADAHLRAATRVSFDRLDSDGCMSTNDQVTLLVSGASGVTPDAAAFGAALTEVCTALAVKLQGDAEGASHDITIEVVNAASEDDAVEVGRSVARNNLFKAAIFGNDPNWGRVLAAIGTTHAAFDPYEVDVTFNGVRLCSAGAPDRPREEVDLTPRATSVVIDLKAGDAAATIFTNDLTHDYVHENSAYSS
ncbi:bifunctional glutamate N-acetyltransferase/amino-acid acetyltransferase ArgJ [Microbacterium sp.]|uniref:bifunctional glutamate N-acetyltransferase/amino-acid acetyltransferase ArgJ n=1 Tax=Microbacterium sp. TaxID=51671 RepID=UPI003C791EAD